MRFSVHSPKSVTFVMEQFINGLVVTYDGLANRDGEVLLAASTRYDQSVMDVVNKDLHMSYVRRPTIDPAIEEAGRKILKAFDVRERFFDLELFQTAEGRVIALEVNMRPPGAWITDAINFTYDIDVYGEWAEYGGQRQGRRPVHRQILHGLCQPQTSSSLSPRPRGRASGSRRQDFAPQPDRRGIQPRHGKLCLSASLEEPR